MTVGSIRRAEKLEFFVFLSEDVANYFQTLGLNTTDSTQQQYSLLTEKKLIENRTGIYLSADNVICAFH